MGERNYWLLTWRDFFHCISLCLPFLWHWILTLCSWETSRAVMCSSFSNPSICHFFAHLPFLLPSGTEGNSAWMRCWVHGNWVVIDWTAAWPMRGQWELEDQSSNTASLIPNSAGKLKCSAARVIFILYNTYMLRLRKISSCTDDHLMDPACDLSEVVSHILLWCHHWKLSSCLVVKKKSLPVHENIS